MYQVYLTLFILATGNTTTTKKRKVATRTTKKSDNIPFSERFNNFISDERYRFFFGLFSLLFCVYLILAFGSYLNNWKTDQSQLNIPWFSFLFNPEIVVENSTGKIGALFAHIFIYKLFGIASFAFLFLFAIFGMKLVHINLLPLRRTSKYIIFGILWVSITLSFFIGESFPILGGEFGYAISNWFVSIMGAIGTFLILLIILFAFLVFTIDGFLIKISVLLKKIPALASLSDNQNSDITQKKETVSTENNSQINNSQNKNTNKRIYEDDEDDHLFEKQIVIDLDTNEPLKTVEKNLFILDDQGRQKPINDDLGFEIEDTNSKTTNEITENNEGDKLDKIVESAEIFDDELQGRLALSVEKNDDILSDDIRNEFKGDYDPTLDLSSFKLPPVELLEDHKADDSEVTNEELISNKNRIVETLKNYKIDITKIKATIGPTITLYEIIPAPGVRISKIKNLEDDIALSLSALGIRIIAPMPGRGTIGIEVPNQKPKIVSMRSVISSTKFQESKYELPIALGKTISNETYVVDLAKMPHLLVAGATGQGKSVGLNAILTSLLYKKHPSQVKLVLVDPKKVELTLYERIEKHYLAVLPDAVEAIITDNSQVVRTVTALNVEMDSRYNLLKKAKVRNIMEYNAKFISRRLNPNNGHKYLPYIVLVIDEFADLIMTAGKEIELPIARIAQLARAIGIHLIVATQRPSTNIITGVIKANFPARIAFKVASMIDSRTILDSPGANQLIGRGDMLITRGSDLIRIQCAFIDTPELEQITQYIEKQQGYPMPYLLPEVEADGENSNSVDLGQKDELFEDAARMVVVHQQGSTSLIQRKLSIGYNRAGRIVDQLEAAGIVGPSKGSKARDVLYYDEYALEQYLGSL